MAGGGGEETTKPKAELEVEIERAMRARLADFKRQADSLTLEGVRRALEKDLAMEAYSLDAHKRFIKKCVHELFYGADDESVSNTSAMGAEEPIMQPMKEETPNEDHHSLEDQKNNTSNSGEKVADSPALVGKEDSENKTEQSEGVEANTDLSEDIIKKAIKKRATYFSANAETISFNGVRRLLEEDLKVEKYMLDAYKSFIRKEIDEVFNAPAVVKSTNGARKKSQKETHQNMDAKKMSQGSKKASRVLDSSDSDDILSEDEEAREEITGSKKRAAPQSKASTERPKKQKKLIEESKSSSSRKKKPVEPDLEKSTVIDSGNSSDDGHSHSYAEEEVKRKKEKPTQAYGKQVEHLKSIIKSCGMSIPPAVYKRAKQAPESKREAYLIKELEEILKREGLSTNPSEKEIKALKKKKERARELEGIDTSNIVSSSRRRTTFSYLPPPKPKVQVESEDKKEEDADKEDDEDEEDEDDDDDDDEEDSDDENDGGDATEGSDEDIDGESE